MPENSSLPFMTDAIAINRICQFVYHAVLETQQQEPELLKERYRRVNWQDARYQSIFIGRLQEELKSTSDPKVRILKVRKFLQLLLEPRFFESDNFKRSLRRVKELTQMEPQSGLEIDLPKSEPENPRNEAAIAILLLDAENLNLDLKTERLLTKICAYPLQIKVAFANWRNLGKRDVELHERHYELIHVPPGKDSADFKMSTVGSSIFVHYPTAKEVLVCSSDSALTHLCTTLQTHGLTVYRVCQKGELITVFNSKTGQNQTYSLKPSPVIPSVREFITQIKQLIKTELERTGNQWIELSVLSNLFKTKYNFTISQVVSTQFPGKNIKEVFLNYPSDFVIHQISENSPLYLTLFEPPNSKMPNGNEANSQSADQPQDSASNSPRINAASELEKALFLILKDLTVKSPGSYISISILGSEFLKQSGKPISQMLKQLQLGGNFLKFIQSCKSFKIAQTEKGWQVAIAE